MDLTTSPTIPRHCLNRRNCSHPCQHRSLRLMLQSLPPTQRDKYQQRCTWFLVTMHNYLRLSHCRSKQYHRCCFQPPRWIIKCNATLVTTTLFLPLDAINSNDTMRGSSVRCMIISRHYVVTASNTVFVASSCHFVSYYMTLTMNAMLTTMTTMTLYPLQRRF